MNKVIFSGLLLLATQGLAAEVVLEKNGVTLTDEEMLGAASDLAEYELEAMRDNNAMLRTFIEKQFDNKVMQSAIAQELDDYKNYKVVSEMNARNFANHYYVKQKALEKIAKVKDFKALAKQTYYSNIKKYQKPQTYDYYHVLFLDQDDQDAKIKAEEVSQNIKDGKITLAEAAKTYHSVMAGTDQDGVLKNVQHQQLFEEIQKAVIAMNVGDVSGVVESSSGYHIIGLKQKNPIETKPYDADVEKSIINELKTKMYRTTDKEIRDQYRGPEGLSVNENLLKSVTEKILQGSRK